MKNVSAIVWVLGLPLVMAAVLGTSTYAWNSYTVNPAPVQADGSGAGSSAKDGFTVTTWESKAGTRYLAVVEYANYIGDDQQRPFLTVYEIDSKGDGKGRLFLIGSRCIEWDRGFPMYEFDEKAIKSPLEMKKLQDRD